MQASLGNSGTQPAVYSLRSFGQVRNSRDLSLTLRSLVCSLRFRFASSRTAGAHLRAPAFIRPKAAAGSARAGDRWRDPLSGTTSLIPKFVKEKTPERRFPRIPAQPVIRDLMPLRRQEMMPGEAGT